MTAAPARWSDEIAGQGSGQGGRTVPGPSQRSFQPAAGARCQQGAVTPRLAAHPGRTRHYYPYCRVRFLLKNPTRRDPRACPGCMKEALRPPAARARSLRQAGLAARPARSERWAQMEAARAASRRCSQPARTRSAPWSQRRGAPACKANGRPGTFRRRGPARRIPVARIAAPCVATRDRHRTILHDTAARGHRRAVRAPERIRQASRPPRAPRAPPRARDARVRKPECRSRTGP